MITELAAWVSLKMAWLLPQDPGIVSSRFGIEADVLLNIDKSFINISLKYVCIV